MARTCNYPPLTAEQQALALAYMPMAHKEAIAARKRFGLPLEELKGEAMLQLCQFASWFDPARGYPPAPLLARFLRQHLARVSVAYLRGYTHEHECLDQLPGRRQQPEEIVDVVDSLKPLLPERTWELVWRRHGIGETVGDIAKSAGVSKTRVNQVVGKAMDWLRSNAPGEFAEV